MIPTRQRKRGERGVSLILGTTAIIFIVPMMGIAIDVGFLYSAKDKLQASVDGAALAAARALTLGATTAAQADSAKQNAVNWFYANFPQHAWDTKNTQMDTTDPHVHVYDDTTNPNVGASGPSLKSSSADRSDRAARRIVQGGIDVDAGIGEG